MLMFTYLGGEIVDTREPLFFSAFRGHLCHVACMRQCVMVLTAILARALPAQELAIQDLPAHDARMRIRTWRGILSPMPQHVHNFSRDIKMQDFVGKSLFVPIKLFLAD